MPRSPLSPLSDTLRKAYSPERFQTVGEKVLAEVRSHLDLSQTRTRPTSFHAPAPEVERAYWKAKASSLLTFTTCIVA